MTGSEDWTWADDAAVAAYLDGAAGLFLPLGQDATDTATYGDWWDLGTIDATYVGEHAFYDLPGEVPALPGQASE